MFEFYIYVTLVSVIMSVGGKLGTSFGDLFRVSYAHGSAKKFSYAVIKCHFLAKMLQILNV